MKDKIEYFLFLSLSYLVRFLGLRLSRHFAYILSLIFFYVIPIRKKTVIENLTHAFPDYPTQKIKVIAFNSYNSFLITLVELLNFPSFDKCRMEKFLVCPNKDLIVEKHQLQKGVILVSAHFGNWEYMALSVSLQIQIPFAIIVKKQSNMLVSDWLDNMRTKFGNKIVPLGLSVRNIYTELKNKNVIAMLADQRGPAEGIRIEFMGRLTSVYSGPAILALKTNAPIIFGIPVRQPDYSYIVYLEELDLNNLPEDKDQKVIEISKRYIHTLEKYIKRFPEQWFWMHKRWKY